MAVPTQTEIHLLDQFRERVGDLRLTQEQNSNIDLVRWLRARDNDLEAAEALLRKAMTYTEECDLKNILSWQPPEDLLRMCPLDIGKHARDKTPVVIIPIGYWDLKGVVEKGLQEEYFKYLHYFVGMLMEQAKGKMTAEGVPISQIYIITEAKNMSVGQFTSLKVLQFLKASLPHLLDYQPERLKKSIYINAGKLFTTVYGIVKPVLTRRTREKIQVFDGPNEWKPQLYSIMDDDQIPKCYGGKADSFLNGLLGSDFNVCN